MATVAYYAREIDAGCGRQNVTVVDGVVTSQELVARNGWYTGDGNPEWVGQNKSVLRGKGFKKVRGPLYFNGDQWVAGSEDAYYDELEATLAE